jgi:hypothetical protein
MARFFRNLLTALKYLFLQGLVEIILVVFLEYLDIKVLMDFSKGNLLIENIQGVVWEISMKTIIFSLVYIPLFIALSSLLSNKKLSNSFLYVVINGVLSILLSIVFLLFLRQIAFPEVLNLLIVTLSSSILILVAAIIINGTKPTELV